MNWLLTNFSPPIFFLFAWHLTAADMTTLDASSVNQYLTRLKMTWADIEGAKDIDLLNKLIQSHLVAIPFENLNMHAETKMPIDISLAAISNKILKHRSGRNRGGYCYEVNELFFHLLKKLGFDARRHKASVWMGKEPGVIPWPSHQLTTVSIGDDIFLMDVGFGLFNIFQAVKLPREIGEELIFIDSQGKTIKFERVKFDANFGEQQSGHEGFIYQRFSERTQKFERVSTFSLQQFEAVDFEEHNDFVQNSYQPFLDNVMFTRFNQDGKMIICVKTRSEFSSADAIMQWINAANSQFDEISW